MLLDESLPQLDSTAGPRSEPHSARPSTASGQGDFATGVRRHAHDASVRGEFATGMSAAIAPDARTSGDFATGLRGRTDTPAIGDFATGMRTRERRPPRPVILDRSRSARARPLARKAA
jgi:hypothetical protein